MQPVQFSDYSSLLPGWIKASQQYLYQMPGRPDLLCYGFGQHGGWSVQTNQKAAAAFAVAAKDTSIDWEKEGLSREKVLEQALALVRYSFHSHEAGGYFCSDGKPWVPTWISVLGMERLMHGVEALADDLTEEDNALIKRVILSEADWHLFHYDISAGLIEDNKPESNIWNGAILYRAALNYPDAPNTAQYIKKAEEYFMAGISIESDEFSEQVYNGRTVREMFKGANFYDSFALNHHKYLNVGYMVICLSNIAMLHFSYKAKGQKAPEAIYHNVMELWKLIRACTFDDGRLWRIGGDTRIRYCYCQDYALPVWALMADKYGENCEEFEKGWLKTLNHEINCNGDGSFLSARCGYMKTLSPLYYNRLESDRACALSMMAYWKRIYQMNPQVINNPITAWHDAYHGSSMIKSENRLASFTWISAEKPQGFCLPANDSSLAESRYNLTGEITGIGASISNNISAHESKSFDGGFLTYGTAETVTEDFLMSEGLQPYKLADKYIAFAALPDDATVLCLQSAKALCRTLIGSVKGMLWNVPNDIFNNSRRNYKFESGAAALTGEEKNESKTVLCGKWVNVDDKIGAVTIDNGGIRILQPKKRQIGVKRQPRIGLGDAYEGGLYCDEVVTQYSSDRRWFDFNEQIFESGFAVLTGNAAQTEKASKTISRVDGLPDYILSISIEGQDGKRYALLYNTGGEAYVWTPSQAPEGITIEKNSEGSFLLEAGRAALFCIR